jgi:hypothetical protein
VRIEETRLNTARMVSLPKTHAHVHPTDSLDNLQLYAVIKDLQIAVVWCVSFS